LSEYTKTGVLLLLIGVATNICATIIVFGYYSTIDLTNLENNLSSLTMILFPIGAIGILAGLMIFLGGLFMFLGRKEHGEKHQKNIFYCIILFIITIGVVLIISLLNIFTMFDTLFSTYSQGTLTLTPEFLKAQLTTSIIQTIIITILSGLIWVLGLYQLEDKKGRSYLIAAYAFMLLSPMVYGVGSYMKLEEWTANGTFDTLTNSTTSMYSQIITLFQWTGITGIFMFIVSLISSLLLFIALRRAHNRINTKDPLPPSSPESPSVSGY
jgi:hypothetical protein